MVPWWSLLIAFGLPSIFFGSLLLLSWRSLTTDRSFWMGTLKMQSQLFSSQTENGQKQTFQLLREANLATAAMADKTLALVGTADPLAFQQVQAMGTPSGYDEPEFDPSDEGEVERINQRNPNLARQGDEVNGFEQSILADLAYDAPGNEYFPPAGEQWRSPGTDASS
jgi:hypothetical protein